MPRVKTESLKEQMVVAVDVKNIDNMLLVPAGCPLTARHIDILRAWGVGEVEVQSADGVADAGDPLSRVAPETLAALTTELKARFWVLDEGSPAAMKIFELMLQRRVRRCLTV